ncbi:MFS general substrate transporter [Polychaeton citri CBS 116435]|uniref:MFS general substrate transporter n=1 Tax=Polychaeton citri CBS 116435 TaxID=1314669 RepID=A0A9P4Q790_9PEZI|nr:MFS general substrate transporter [Polychaeton citri CBS 116435]
MYPCMYVGRHAFKMKADLKTRPLLPGTKPYLQQSTVNSVIHPTKNSARRVVENDATPEVALEDDVTTYPGRFDSNCVATIIPVMKDEFHSLNDVGWYGTAYLITSASKIVLYGKFYKHYPAKRVCLLALSIYTVGSIVCATAASSLAFMLGRAIAGLGSAGLVAGVNMESVAIAIGPLIGGAVTSASSWRATLYISIPIGAINGLMLSLFGKMPDAPDSEAYSWGQSLKELYLTGTVIFASSIVCLVLALAWAGSQYSWNNFRVILTLVPSGGLALAFALLQYFKIVTQRSIVFSSLFSFYNSVSLFVITFYLPIYFQAIKGANTLTSGAMSLPLVGGLIIAGIATGYVTTWIGCYTPSMIASCMLTSVGTGLISTLNADSSETTWIVFQLLAGLGCGLGFQPPYMAAQTVVYKSDVPVALLAVGFAQRLGNIVCLAAAQNVFSSQLLENLDAMVPQVNPKIVLDTGHIVLRAYSATLDQVFHIAVALSCLSLIGALGTEWKSVKRKK